MHFINAYEVMELFRLCGEALGVGGMDFVFNYVSPTSVTRDRSG